MSTTEEPVSIDIESGSIIVDWGDSHKGLYPPRFLRLSCPCAECVEEMTGVRKVDPKSIPEDIMALDSIQVGNYGVQFLWSDAHYTGIYTYQFLKDHCPCDKCKNGREGNFLPK